MKKNLIITAIIAVIFAVVIFLYQQQQVPQSTDGTQTMATSTVAKPIVAAPATTSPVVSTTTTPGNHPGMKLYRNEQLGFEFWFPEGWEWQENVFGSPFSKFNLTLMKIDGKNTNQNDVINIVTQSFFENYLVNMQRLGSKKSEIVVGNVTGSQYHYILDGRPTTDVSFSLGEFMVLFGVEGQREGELFNILSTLKFTK